MDSIAGKCDILRLPTLSVFIIMSRINQIEDVLYYDCSARPAAVFIIGRIGSKGDRKMLPCRKIAAFRMTPLHQSPLRRIRMKLIEYMIFSSKIDEAVRVVHPTAGRRKMIEGFIKFVHVLSLL